VSIVFVILAFFTKEAIRLTIACFTFVSDVSDGTFPLMFIFGVRTAAFETNNQFGITTAPFDHVSKAVAAVTLGEWRVGDEFLSGGTLAEKGGRVADHEF
jgi:hypothetical protein